MNVIRSIIVILSPDGYLMLPMLSFFGGFLSKISRRKEKKDRDDKIQRKNSC